MTWNCRVGAFRKKAARMAPYSPDVLVVPEVERLDGLLFLDGERQPTFSDRVARPGEPRGLGVFSYSGVRMERAFNETTELPGFAPFQAERGQTAFQVAAVWTFQTPSAATSYRQAHIGIAQWADWIRRSPTVILGDFNLAANFQGGKSWRDLTDLLAPLGLVSAYHHFYREDPGRESRPTHFHRGKADATWHIDYCFIPKTWANRVTNVEVGTYDEWRDVSDHAPLIVDVDLE